MLSSDIVLWYVSLVVVEWMVDVVLLKALLPQTLRLGLPYCRGRLSLCLYPAKPAAGGSQRALTAAHGFQDDLELQSHWLPLLWVTRVLSCAWQRS